jgi:hypothetical protein
VLAFAGVKDRDQVSGIRDQKGLLGEAALFV